MGNTTALGIETKLWEMADALRNNMDAAEYKHVVLGLIFLKYISDAFEAKHAELEAQRDQGADPEDPDEYRAASIFWVPKEARWAHLRDNAPQPKIGNIVDEAMTAIERDNPSLKGVLPKDYSRPGLDKQRLGQLINLVSDIGLGSAADRAKDVLGRVYEYFLAQFASAEGKKGGQFYTPSHVVRILVEMLAPYKGRVYDPCCGSGGMFVSSEKFIEAHSGKLGDISIYGQESNYTTWRLAKMNLAIRGIDAQIAHGDTFHNDRHPDLKADWVMANPPFNDSDWRGELLKEDRRWIYGVPPAGNANFAWVQHFIYHVAPTGLAGFVLANGSMSSNQSGEGDIRKAIIEADLVDCMVALPGQLFYATQVPVCLWLAKDLVKHFEERLEAMDGKAMIVCMSRRICVDLYNEIVKLRSDWHNENDEAGVLKIVMTGSATDGPEWQRHIRDKRRRESLGKRFKDAKDPFKVVIVRDMWLTGFDVPSLHTMYVDKPMRGHGLMQAIARVNRVFKDKPGGLVVDYLGIAHELKLALTIYTESGGKGTTALPQEEAVSVMLEKYEICRGLLHGFNWSAWITGTSVQKLGLLPNAQEHILKQEDGKNRLIKVVTDLSKAFALAVPHDEALPIRDDVGFFQALRSVLTKSATQQHRPEQELDNAIRQIVSQAVFSGEVVDIFAAAGLKKPDISILSEEFLAEVNHLPQKNLAVELLRKLLNDEIKTRARRNVVKSRLFSSLLESSIRKYQNRAIQAAQVIEELIGLARQIREQSAKGEELGLSEDEVAFYDALEVNDSAVKVLGDATLKTIARELVGTVRRNTTIDWTVRENIRANLRVLVKRILRKYGYPPDKQEKATLTVLEQAEALSANWATA